MRETWKAVPGYEGQYEVSDRGRVRSLKRRVVLAPCTVSGGYVAVSLGRNNSKLVHRLVAATFLGAPPTGKHLVLHSDGTRDNNTLENLRYGSHADNSLDAIKHGTQVKGARQHAAKLSAQDVTDIRHSALNQRSLAKYYGVTAACICAIIKRKNWRHV